MPSAIFAEHRTQQRAEILRVGRTDNNCQRVLPVRMGVAVDFVETRVFRRNWFRRADRYDRISSMQVLRRPGNPTSGPASSRLDVLFASETC